MKTQFFVDVFRGAAGLARRLWSDETLRGSRQRRAEAPRCQSESGIWRLRLHFLKSPVQKIGQTVPGFCELLSDNRNRGLEIRIADRDMKR